MYKVGGGRELIVNIRLSNIYYSPFAFFFDLEILLWAFALLFMARHRDELDRDFPLFIFFSAISAEFLGSSLILLFRIKNL